MKIRKIRIGRKRKTKEPVVKKRRKRRGIKSSFKLSGLKFSKKPSQAVGKPLQSVTREKKAEKKPTNYLALAMIMLGLWFFWEIVTIFVPIELFAISRMKPATADAEYDTDISPAAKLFPEYEKNFKERRLFTPSLVSDEVASLVNMGSKELLENLSLIGIMSTSSGYRAIISDKKERTNSIYKKGDEISGFTIESIKSDRVVFRYAEATFELTRQ